MNEWILWVVCRIGELNRVMHQMSLIGAIWWYKPLICIANGNVEYHWHRLSLDIKKQSVTLACTQIFTSPDLFLLVGGIGLVPNVTG